MLTISPPSVIRLSNTVRFLKSHNRIDLNSLSGDGLNLLYVDDVRNQRKHTYELLQPAMGVEWS
jgi:hypothetical protein